MNGKVKQAIEGILARFENGDIPKAIAYSVFPPPNIPSARWSLMNRVLMWIAGTNDARGIRQWNQVGRVVKKGAKAFYILAPRMVKKETAGQAECEESKGEEEK